MIAQRPAPRPYCLRFFVFLLTTTITMTLELRAICAEDDPMLLQVLALSNLVLSSEPASKYGSLPSWQHRLAATTAAVLYLAPETALNEPVAFLFAHPRTHDVPLHAGGMESVHIWLAGVLSERRKEGCLGRMVSALVSTMPLTICTPRSRYPEMWNWLVRRDWRVERELGNGKEMFNLSHV